MTKNSHLLRALLTALTASFFLGCQTTAPTDDDVAAETPEVNDGESTPDEARPTHYTDQLELYTAPIPEEWVINERDDFTTLAAPDGDVRVHLSAAQTDDMAEALANAWQNLDDPPQLQIAASASPDTPDGVEKYFVVTYQKIGDYKADAATLLLDGVTYILLVEGEVAALQEWESQLHTTIDGFRPTAVVDTD